MNVIKWIGGLILVLLFPLVAVPFFVLYAFPMTLILTIVDGTRRAREERERLKWRPSCDMQSK